MARNTYSVDEKLEKPFNINNFKQCKKYIMNNLTMLIVGMVLSLVATVLSLCGPIFIKRVIDCVERQQAAGTNDLTEIIYIALTYLTVIILSETVQFFQTLCTAKAGQQIVHEMRVDIFKHIQDMSFNYFDSRPRGKILVRVVHYVNNVADFLSSGLINSVVQFMTVFIIIFFMFSLDFRLSLYVLSGLPLFIVFVFIIKKRQKQAWTDFSAKNSNTTAYISESISGMQITQAFNREKENQSIFDGLLDKFKKAYYKALAINLSVPIVIDFLSSTMRMLLYVAAIVLLANRHYTASTVVAMASYALRFWYPIEAIGNIYNQLVDAGSYLERIFDTLGEPVEIKDNEGAYDIPEIQGNVEYDDVTFAYEEGINILNHISFSVKAGQSVAFVGPTGAGKSTIVNLLCRFYDIQNGQIRIDGHDIKGVTLKSLRSSMGIMLQDSFIFSGTIKDNIRYGKLDATDEEIINAAKTVCAHDFIMSLEKGYDTEITENGSMLSQGQRQLICFARTVISDPKILILDEATSSIDTETEQYVQMGLEKMMQGRTSFIIAHRLSTIVNCDTIMYVDRKSILETGSHAELLEKKGAYYDLYTAQLKESNGKSTDI